MISSRTGRQSPYRIPSLKELLLNTGPLPSSSDFALDKSVHEFNVEKAKETVRWGLTTRIPMEMATVKRWKSHDWCSPYSFTRNAVSREASQQQLKRLKRKFVKVGVSAVAAGRLCLHLICSSCSLASHMLTLTQLLSKLGSRKYRSLAMRKLIEDRESAATETDQKKRIQLSPRTFKPLWIRIMVVIIGFL